MITVGVIGSGVMGAGIAQLAAVHLHPVVLMDVSAEIVQRAIEGIERSVERLVEKGKLSGTEKQAVIARLSAAEGPRDLAACRLVIEAVAENLDTKIKVLAGARAHLSRDAIIASNTSSLSITKIGKGINEPRRVVGMHFFNPAPLMPLVEVIDGNESAPAAADAAAALAKSWGKTVVRAKDTPGFIVNRVARGYYLEALRILGEGKAAVDEIDGAMRSLGGFRMGPFELMDLVGTDVNYSVSTSVWQQLGEPPRLRPHPIQADLLARGQLGRKTKRGFYDYATTSPIPTVQRERTPFAPSESLKQAVDVFVSRATSEKGSEPEKYFFARILTAVINEAAMALAEGVASREDIDTALRLGTNYPHGPLEWAARIGIDVCHRVLLELNAETSDNRFAPQGMFS